MNELIAKLKESGKESAFNSPEEFSAAAKDLGFSEEDINAAVGTVSFPLSDDELETVAGGVSFRPSVTRPEAQYQKEFEDAKYRAVKDALIAKIKSSRCEACGFSFTFAPWDSEYTVYRDSNGYPTGYRGYCNNPLCDFRSNIDLDD